MKTTKPTSTISYNTPDYLKLKLESLRKARILEFWAFIEHEPEEDEKRKHIHLLIFPAKLIQTEDVRDELAEYDPTHPDKPLGCQPFRSSVFADWYLYSKHDPDYLASKGMSRKYHYKREHFRTSDDDYFDELIKDIDRTNATPYGKLKEAIVQGLTFEDMVALGQVPIPQIVPYQKAFYDLKRGLLNRNGRKTHTPKDETPLMKAEAEARALIEKAEREAQEIIRKARLEDEARANVDRYLEGFDDYLTPPTSDPDISVVIDTKTGEAHELAEYDPEGELPF